MIFGRKRRVITRLLVVEDEPLVAFDTEHLLTEEGYEVVATVDRVADAVAAIERDAAIDLILADINLADGNGIDVARHAQARGIAVLFVSSLCPADAAALAVGCLVKPYAQRDLLGAVDAIDRTRPGKRPRSLPSGLRLFAG